MAQRNSRASVGEDENVLSFPPPPDKGATALNLVYQAADAFRSMEEHARETEARAQSLCASALERLRLAEMRAEAAERVQRELTITAEHRLQGACRALQQAQSCIEAQKDKLTQQSFAPKLPKPKRDKPRKRSRSLKKPFASVCFAQTRMPIAG
jgi:hypothetical protein